MFPPFVRKMSPNRVFDHAFEAVRNNPEVKRRFGDSLKAYGRDHGGHREGRRNFVENTQYKDEHGDDRTRVRFNLEGRFGKAFVFAEVIKSMPAGEFVYGMCIRIRAIQRRWVCSSTFVHSFGAGQTRWPCHYSD